MRTTCSLGKYCCSLCRDAMMATSELIASTATSTHREAADAHTAVRNATDALRGGESFQNECNNTASTHQRRSRFRRSSGSADPEPEARRTHENDPNAVTPKRETKPRFGDLGDGHLAGFGQRKRIAAHMAADRRTDRHGGQPRQRKEVKQRENTSKSMQAYPMRPRRSTGGSVLLRMVGARAEYIL